MSDTRKRQRRKLSTSVIETVDVEILREFCCVPVLVATFRNERLAELNQRHVGRFCAGTLDPVDVKEWRSVRGLR